MADIFTRLLLNTNDFEAKLSRSKKEVGEMEGSFASVGKTAVAGFGAIAGAVGIAYGGVEMFNKVVNSSNEMTDRWDAVCRSAKSSVDEFFYSLTTGDFTFFNSGLDEMIRKAQIAAGALDQLGNTSMSYGYFNTRNQADFAEAITVLRDKEVSATDKTAAMATANAVMGDQREITTQLRRRVQETMQALVTESNTLKAGDVSLFDVEKVIRLDVSAMGDGQKDQLKKQYDSYKKEIIDARGQFTTEIMTMDGVDISINQEGFDAAASKINAKYQDAILYNTILVKKSDEWLQNLLNIVGAADNAERVVAGMSKTYNRATQGGLNTNGLPKKIKAPVESAESGSMAFLDEQIKKASAAVSSAVTDDARIAAQKTLDKLTAKRIEMEASLKITTDPIEGSIDYINAKLKKLQADFDAAGSADARRPIQEQMKSLNAQKTQITDGYKATAAVGSLDYINEQITQAQGAMSAATSDAARTAAQKLINELENQKIILTIEAKHGPIGDMTMDQKIKLDVPTPEVEAYRKSMADADKAQKAMQKSATDMSSGFGAVGQAVANVSSVAGEGAAPMLEWGANVLNAISMAIPAIAALTVAKSAESVATTQSTVTKSADAAITGLQASATIAGTAANMAAIPAIVALTTARQAEASANAAAAVTGGAASIASIPIVGWIMAGAAVAAIVASFASIPKFADGGIVGGSSYFGDKVLAAVNSGEMILNKNQQRNLSGLIGEDRQQVTVGGTFRMSGRDMVAILRQEEKFQKR